MKKIAFFDFDNTITRKDSLIKFIRFSVGDIQAILGMLYLLPMLVKYKLKFIPNYIAKEIMLSHYFKGMTAQQFRKLTTEYSLEHIDRIIEPKAINKINWHKQQGHKVVVVSASIECWLKPWCNKNSLGLIATQIEIKDNIVTGKLLSENCHGIEKVNRINEVYNLHDYDYIYAYGDSRGDKELLELADESFYKSF